MDILARIEKRQADRLLQVKTVWEILQDRKYATNWDTLKKNVEESNDHRVQEIHNIDALIIEFKKFIALKVLEKVSSLSSLLSSSSSSSPSGYQCQSSIT